MSEKTAKPKKAGAGKRGEESVLGSLPATRPNRLGRARDGAKPAKPVSQEAIADVAQAAAKPKPRAAAKPKPKAAAKPKPKAAAEPKPKAAAKPKPKAAARPKPKPAAPVAPRTAAGGPTPVRPATPSLGEDVPTDAQRPSGTPQSGTELVTTVVQAAGELAQIGFTVGGQILRRAVDRLPKP